ncbi:hypothetical protein L6272_02715, partial [Microgenomates group bacterium]|nr:hypothetical protein [Microgenomates group bacterium]
MDNPGLQPSITPPPPATPPPVPPIPPPPPPPPPVPVEQPQIQVPVKKNLKLKKFLPLGLVMILLIGGLFLGKNLLLEKQRPVEKLAVDCGVKPDGTPLHCNDLTEVCCLTGCKPASEGCGDSPGGGETCSNESPTVT